MGIGEAEAFSERLKRELQALEAANVHAILENEPLIDEVTHFLVKSSCCFDASVKAEYGFYLQELLHFSYFRQFSLFLDKTMCLFHYEHLLCQVQ